MPTKYDPIYPPSNAHDLSLAQWFGPVLDQGNEGACFENAVVTILDAMMRQAGHPLAPLSRQGYYNNVREAQYTFGTDSGTVDDFGFKVLQTKGIGFESTFAYGTGNLYVHPGSDYAQEAAQHRLGGVTYMNIETQYTAMANDVKVKLAEGKPVLLAFRVEPWFFNEYGPMHDLQGWGNEAPVGGHAVAIVGYDENGTPSDPTDDFYVIKNSWGESWGDHGYGKIAVKEFSINENSANPNNPIGFYTLNGFDGLDFTFSRARLDVAELYVALLNRAPDLTGMDWWAATHQTQGQLCTELLKCSEEQAIFSPDMTNAQFIDSAYINVLGRVPGTDAEGRAFWTDALSNKSRGDILAEIIQLTRDYIPGSSAKYDLDAIHSKHYFQDRVDVAMHVAVTYQSDDLNLAHIALIGVTDHYDSVVSAEQTAAGYLHLL